MIVIQVNTQDWVKDLLTEFGIRHGIITSFVHDNGSNIDLAGRLLEEELGWATIGCAGHTLQLCVNSGLKINRKVVQAISASRKLATHFRKSEPAMRALRIWESDMKVPSHNLIHDVSMRWNSTYYMIDCLFEQRWPITAVLSDSTVTKSSDKCLDLKSKQWDILEPLQVILGPLEVATTYPSAEYNLLISALLPVLFGLIKLLETLDSDTSTIRQAKVEISSQIQRRWNLNNLLIAKDNFYLMSSFLDPTLNNCKFLNTHPKMEVTLLLIQLLTEIKESNLPHSSSEEIGSSASNTVFVIISFRYSFRNVRK
ncbi:PREDICTED: zinc finger BED domain-containing protein 4-like [Amphimedon queenslandica]|uniref:DUF659 domain-containing protein n=1 Tax=Amphimedon queenslandica TaxID=400682 RepID=A0AAN0IQ62_AMPQE|nr:PREDICTED: zinc finger BED domain-containing protein 4-like [Amphimedon queenslandica]|eukprot:XP_011405991.1 PREDICTED: zinc finger BED domain-containing protein 4-like [Amphimedon queenslandica]